MLSLFGLFRGERLAGEGRSCCSVPLADTNRFLGLTAQVYECACRLRRNYPTRSSPALIKLVVQTHAAASTSPPHTHVAKPSLFHLPALVNIAQIDEYVAGH